METDLEIRPTGKFGNKGERYDVLLSDEVIASGSSPECAACRVLMDRGITGNARFWWPGKAHWSLRMGINWGAAHYVSETARSGPRFAKWAPNQLYISAEAELEDA
jgi:hypothetical protein